MAKGLNRVPVREQEPKVRATNFDEVCLGYNKDEAEICRNRTSGISLFLTFSETVILK